MSTRFRIFRGGLILTLALVLGTGTAVYSPAQSAPGNDDAPAAPAREKMSGSEDDAPEGTAPMRGLVSEPAAEPAPAPPPAPVPVPPRPAALDPDVPREIYTAGEEGVEFVEGDVVIIKIHEIIDKPTEVFLRKMLKQAERNGASAFIIDMDTPGGRVDVTQEILKMLNRSTVPTYTYVNPNAISAGSLIAIGTDNIYMAPFSVIGAAAIVTGGGADLPETMQDKANAILTATVRDTAKAHGHNPELAEAFIDKDVEVKIGDEIISESGDLLALSAEEAIRVIDGQKVLAEAIADDIPALANHAGLEGQLILFDKSGFEKLGAWLAALAPVLLLIGIAGAYLEFQMPGFGIPGFISIIAFGLFFFGHQVVGLAGYELVAIFILGVVFLVVELFILPGFFVFGVLGLLMIVGAAFFAMVDTWPGGVLPEIGDLSSLIPATINMLLAIAGASIIAGLAAVYLPKSPMFRRFALSDSVGGLTPAPIEGVSVDPAEQPLQVGEVGEALQDLRPVGKAAFREGQVIRDVLSAGLWIERGTRLRIVQASSSRIQVEPTMENPDSPQV